MVETIITALIVLSTTVGGYAAGKRTGTADAVGVATQTVELLKVQIETITGTLEKRDQEIKDLTAKVQVLESLVTQRANVEDVRTVVERIAGKIGA